MAVITKNDYEFIKKNGGLEQEVIVKGARVVMDKTLIFTDKFIYETDVVDKITIDKQNFILNKRTLLYESETDKDKFVFKTKIKNIFIDLKN